MGLSQRQIVRGIEELAYKGEDNALWALNANGDPWKLTTVNSDLQAIEKEWKTESLRATGELKGRLLAQLRELQKKGWGNADYTLVLNALKQERDLLGLDEPFRFQDVTEEDVDREIAERLSHLADGEQAAVIGEVESQRRLN